MKHGVSSKWAHRWLCPKRLPWLKFCWRCGLMALRNEATERAVRAGCFPEDET